MDIFEPSGLSKSGKCMYCGGSQPKASYKTRCFGAEVIHSSPRITWLIFIR